MIGSKNIPKDWQEDLADFLFDKKFLSLMKFINQEYKTKTIYPKSNKVFKALELTKLSDVKVVILGQDPYHEQGQASGLAFSVPSNIALLPSLKNIYEELKKESIDGDLSSWAKQGVLLLNSILTVVDGQAASHSNKGWEDFTDRIIKLVSDKNQSVVFMLWGNYAQTKKSLIDGSKHLILTAAHPSPLSAYRGFFGSNHFVLVNNYLKKHKKSQIKW